MKGTDSTRWSVVRGAAEGRESQRLEFARRYEPVIRAYLGARWARTPLFAEIDDAAQDVFVDCFRENGALTRVDSERPGGFRAFLFGVVRNVARRVEERRRRAAEPADAVGHLEEIAAAEESFTRAFDRAWARAILKQAAAVQEERAREAGADALRRVDLLRLRFLEGIPIREIATRWEEDPARVHTQYAKARDEFKAALREVIRSYDPVVAVNAECARLLDHLS